MLHRRVVGLLAILALPACAPQAPSVRTIDDLRTIYLDLTDDETCREEPEPSEDVIDIVRCDHALLLVAEPDDLYVTAVFELSWLEQTQDADQFAVVSDESGRWYVLAHDLSPDELQRLADELQGRVTAEVPARPVP